MTVQMAIAALIGCLVGVVAVRLIDFFSNAHGVLRIDHSNPDKELYRFEIDDLSQLDNKTYIELKIDHKANLR